MNKIAFAILAAGESKRFGEEKMLYSYNGGELLQSQIDKFNNINMQSFIVIKPFLKDKFDPKNFKILENKKFKNGISTSIRLLLNNIFGSYIGVIIHLGDMPLIYMEDIIKIEKKAIESPDKFIFFSFQGKKGFPTYIPSKCFSFSSLLEGDKGAFFLVKKKIIDYISIEGERRHIFDIDWKKDIKKEDGF